MIHDTGQVYAINFLASPYDKAPGLRPVTQVMRARRTQPLHDNVLLIRRIRLETGLTLEALALEIGVSTGTLGKWETGETKISLDNLLKIADFFDRPIADFIVDGDGLDPEERELVAAMRQSRRNRTMLMATLRGLQETDRNEFEHESPTTKKKRA